jgi:hypothetical protein
MCARYHLVPHRYRRFTFVISAERCSSGRSQFPNQGDWFEVFNSDIYEPWFNPLTAGNGMRVFANGPAWNGLETSADIVVPANSLLVFARDRGES